MIDQVIAQLPADVRVVVATGQLDIAAALEARTIAGKDVAQVLPTLVLCTVVVLQDRCKVFHLGANSCQNSNRSG
jgi:hypothetical protein